MKQCGYRSGLVVTPVSGFVLLPGTDLKLEVYGKRIRASVLPNLRGLTVSGPMTVVAPQSFALLVGVPGSVAAFDFLAHKTRLARIKR